MGLILINCIDKPMQIRFIVVTSNSLLFLLYILDFFGRSSHKFLFLYLDVLFFFILLFVNCRKGIRSGRGIIIDGLSPRVKIWSFISSKSQASPVSRVQLFLHIFTLDLLFVPMFFRLIITVLQLIWLNF